MKKKIISMILASVMVFTTLCGCGSGQGQNTESGETTEVASEAASGQASSDEQIVLSVSVMANEEEKKIFENTINRFETSHPNCKVDASYTSGSTWGEYCDKLLIQIGSGQAPDVIHVAIEGTQMLVKNNVLLPLDDLIAADPEGKAMMDDFVDSTTDVFTIDGNLYELPTDCNDAVVHVNTKMFQEAGIEIPYDGWTWEEFRSIAKQLTTGEGDSKVYGFGTSLSPAWLAGWFMSNGS